MAEYRDDQLIAWLMSRHASTIHHKKQPPFQPTIIVGPLIFPAMIWVHRGIDDTEPVHAAHTQFFIYNPACAHASRTTGVKNGITACSYVGLHVGI